MQLVCSGFLFMWVEKPLKLTQLLSHSKLSFTFCSAEISLLRQYWNGCGNLPSYEPSQSSPCHGLPPVLFCCTSHAICLLQNTFGSFVGLTVNVKSWHEKGKNPYKMTRTSNILLNSSYVTEADLLEIYRANTCNPCTWANSRESAFPWTGQACKAGTRQKLVWKSPVVSVNGWPRVAGYLCYISVLMFLFVCLFIQHNRRQGIKSCSHPSSFPSLFPSASSFS